MDLNTMQIRHVVSCLGLLLFSSLVTSSFGQEIKRDTVVVENEGKFSVMTNGFWDNWFIGAGAGGQIYFADHNRQMKLTERLSPAFTFYLGKSFSPGIAVRAGVGGFKIVGVTQNGSHSTGEVYDASKWLDKKEYNYYQASLDVLFNFSNIFGGFRQDRFYTISPYLGVGWMQTSDEPAAREVSANIGVFNTFRLGSALDLILDVRGSMVNDRFDGEMGRRREEGILATTLGLAYKFQKRGWEKPKTTIISYDETALVALRNRMAALEKDNEALKKLVEDSRNKTITDVKFQNRVLAAPILITFPINSSVVSNEARVNLGYFANVIKEDKSNVVYKLTGYADKGTGTAETNQRLSRERAEAIYRVLVKEFSVPAAQLEVSHEGGIDNKFYNDPRLSRAVITIAK
jgi:outer membrane protein OmpA-like peptidoglycan-associated protein